MELISLYLVAAGLLCVAGAAKAARPDDTARALAQLVPGRAGQSPFRGARLAVRTGAVLEAALGAAAIAYPRPVTAALVALSYLGFTIVIAVARSKGGPLATCGCFGRPDTPATGLHLLVNLGLAVAAGAVAVSAPSDGRLSMQLAHQPWAGVPLLVVSATGLWLTTLALSSLAALSAARRLARPQPVRAA